MRQAAGGVVAAGDGALGYALVHGDDPYVVQHRLADKAPRQRRILFVQFLGQDHVHPVARPDQAAVAGDGVDADRDGAGAGRQHGGEKAAVARVQHVAGHQDVAGVEIVAQQRAAQAGTDLRSVGQCALAAPRPKEPPAW